MICLNANNDSNDSAVNYSPLTLSSSPVRSSSIKQLLESPIIRADPQMTRPELPVSRPESDLQVSASQSSERSGDSDTDLEADKDLDEVIVAESPERTPDSSQEGLQTMDGLFVTEVANTQSFVDEDSNDTNVTTNGRNCLRRQSSVSTINTNITSSPRALAILKSAMKSSYNSNRSCDKINNNNEDMYSVDSNRNTNELNGTQSPPNHKLLRNSPFSRGSALLRAAKERLERQEFERSPKLSHFSDKSSTDSSYDRQLTSILRKHELQSSPTSGEPKAKKKKVLFAEPVVSSKLEFIRPSPSPTCGVGLLDRLTEFGAQLPEPLVHSLSEEPNEKKRNPMVHQNSTFDKEFDTNSLDSQNSQNSDSPILITTQYFEDELDEPSCGQHHNPIIPIDFSDDTFAPNRLMSSCDSDSSGDSLMCSQVLPESTGIFNDEESYRRASIGVQTVPIEESIETYNDPIVNLPIRLSLIKELYHLFGNVIKEYSDDS